MSRRPDTRDAIVAAALAYADEHGIDSLTLRGLGRATGLHHTAIYRHFRSKEEILNALFEQIAAESMAGIGELPTDPGARIIAIALALRAGLHEHPAVAGAYLQPEASIADSLPARQLQGLILSSLSELGLEGHALAQRYQILESYVLGATAFDFSGAPAHLESRRQRHRMADGQDLEAESRETDTIDLLNEEAFALGLRTLVSAFTRDAQP